MQVQHSAHAKLWKWEGRRLRGSRKDDARLKSRLCREWPSFSSTEIAFDSRPECRYACSIEECYSTLNGGEGGGGGGGGGVRSKQKI